MDTKDNILKYMNFFAHKAIEGKGIKDISNGKIIKDENKYQENYTYYNAMMAGYFMAGEEYHDKILYRKYLNDIVKTEGTPKSFVGMVNDAKLEEVYTCLKDKANNSKSDWFNMIAIIVKEGAKYRSIINNLESKKKELYTNAIYDMAYRFDEVFNSKRETLEASSKSKSTSKVLIKEKSVLTEA